MELKELEKELLTNNRYLLAKLTEQRPLVEKASAAERDYRIALQQKITSLKIEGFQVTIIPDLARGDKTVADLKYKRDVAQGVSDACREAIRAIRSTMSGLQSLISAYKAQMELR